MAQGTPIVVCTSTPSHRPSEPNRPNQLPTRIKRSKEVLGWLPEADTTRSDVIAAKSLELFLASLVSECVKDAEARGSTKISAYGL